MLQQHLIASAFKAAQTLGFAVLVLTTGALVVSLWPRRNRVAGKPILLARMCPPMNADHNPEILIER